MSNLPKKQWEHDNRHLLSLNRKRSSYKERLIRYGILPNDYPYTKYQEEISDKLKSNQFDELSSIISNKKTESLVHKRKISKGLVDRTIRLKENRLLKIINAGLLPKDYHNLETEQHKEIYNTVMNQMDIQVSDIISTYINDANLETKQRYLYNKLKIKVNQPVYKKKGKFVDIKPEDIIVNEYCPFLGVKIDYRTFPCGMFVNNSHSFDRIVNSKGYVTGNVWIISRLANTMKNEATDEQLKTFCKNIVLTHAR